MLPLITERDQRRADDPLNLANKLMDWDIQRHIRQEAQDQWRTLFESSDLATNPKRYWSLLRKLGGKRSSPDQISYSTSREKRHSSSQAIAQVFNWQVTACSAQNDRALRMLMRDLHYHHRVDLSYRPFDKSGVAAATHKSGSSTVQGPDELIVLPLCHPCEHSLTFLMELFNLSYRPISLLCLAVKILERLLLPSIAEALDTRPSQQ